MKYEREVVANLVKCSGGDNFLEIGTKDGDLVRDVLSLSPECKVTTVDCSPSKKFYNAFGDDSRVKLVKFMSDAAYRRMSSHGDKFSNIYIDADHSYKWVKHDIKNYWNLWDHEGFFGGHDFIKKKQPKYGVIDAVVEFFGIPNWRAINRLWQVRNGTIFVSGTNWIYTENMILFKDYLTKL